MKPLKDALKLWDGKLMGIYEGFSIYKPKDKKCGKELKSTKEK